MQKKLIYTLTRNDLEYPRYCPIECLGNQTRLFSFTPQGTKRYDHVFNNTRNQATTSDYHPNKNRKTKYSISVEDNIRNQLEWNPEGTLIYDSLQEK